MTTSGLPDSFNSETAYQKSQQKSVVKSSQRFRHYNLLFLAVVSIPLLAVGLFNWAIDPYGVFNSPEIIGINQAKPEKLKNGRLFKAVDITRIKPTTIFLGSSRTEYGLDPKHPALKNSQPAYNSALGAATPYELFRYLEHAIVNQPELELVILGLDEFMFNELNKEGTGLSESRLEKRHLTIQDGINASLSIQALQASQNTISLSKKFPEYRSFTQEGQLNLRQIDRDRSATKYRFERSTSIYFNAFPEYKLSQQYLTYLQKIVDLCREKDIELHIFISPAHAARLQIIDKAGHWQMYEQMKREIVNITPVWDFSGYNSITTEKINNDMQNYIDESHYRKQVGDLVINRILSYQTEEVPQDFGVLITPQNIEEHLQKIRSEKVVWSNNNPDAVELVRKVYLQSKK